MKHAERSGFDFPDSTLRDVDAIPGGWAWIPASGDRIMIRQNGQTRNVSMPAGYASVFTLTADGAASRLAFAGWDAATHDSLLVSLLTLGDGSVTRWAAVPADGGYVIMPGDGSVLLTVYEGQESLAFFKLTAPGQLERPWGLS